MTTLTVPAIEDVGDDVSPFSAFCGKPNVVDADKRQIDKPATKYKVTSRQRARNNPWPPQFEKPGLEEFFRLAFRKLKSTRVDLLFMAIPQESFYVAESLNYTLDIKTMRFRIRAKDSEFFHAKTHDQALHVTTRPGAQLECHPWNMPDRSTYGHHEIEWFWRTTKATSRNNTIELCPAKAGLTDFRPVPAVEMKLHLSTRTA